MNKIKYLYQLKVISIKKDINLNSLLTKRYIKIVESLNVKINIIRSLRNIMTEV